MTAAVTAVAAADYPRDECESCHAPIIWTKTTNAIAQPVDFEPTAAGNIALEWRAGTVLSKVVKPALAFGRKDLRTPHHMTCPHGGQWRRNRSRS